MRQPVVRVDPEKLAAHRALRAARREAAEAERVTKIASRLETILAPCRPDMHEPDEEGIECRVLGYRLDNAMGERIEAKALTEGWQEFVVVIERLSNGERVVEVFNLADLLALARDGAKLYTEDV